MSSAVKQVPKMPNHQCIMEEAEKESRFTNCDIFAYVKDGKYPADYTKDEKRALRKRAKFFVKVGESEWCCSKCC